MFTKCIPNLCSPNFQNPFHCISLYNCCILSPLVEEFHVQFPPQEERRSKTNCRFWKYNISFKITKTCSIGIHEREKRNETLPCHIFYLSWQKRLDIAWLRRIFITKLKSQCYYQITKYSRYTIICWMFCPYLYQSCKLRWHTV